MTDDLQSLCEDGQRQLMQMEYLRAEAMLARAEQIAWVARDWDTLARLYMPLQECRRQRRQRCGEGIVCLNLLAGGSGERIDPHQCIEQYPHGQLLIAGWGTIAPAVEFRRLQTERGLYAETFLAAVFPVTGGAGRAVVIVPRESDALPTPGERTIEELRDKVPQHSIVIQPGELSSAPRAGDCETYARVMGFWERLHSPFLQAADVKSDPIDKMAAYRVALSVDYASELAHQKLSDVAHESARRARIQNGVQK